MHSNQNHRIGMRTIRYQKPVKIKNWATVAGRNEQEGKLSGKYDYIYDNNRLGQKSWERAEQRLQQTAVELALEKAGLAFHDLSYYMGGVLLNQIVATSYTARMTDVPYIGLYGACSSLAEGMPDLPVAPQDEAGLTTTFQTWPRGWFHIPKDPDFPVPS